MNRDKHEAITGWYFVGVDLGQSRDFTALLLQRGALQIAAGLQHGPELVTELTGMRVRVGGEGRREG